MTDLREARRTLMLDYVIDTNRHVVVRRPQPDEPPPRMPPPVVGWRHMHHYMQDFGTAWRRVWRWLWRMG